MTNDGGWANEPTSYALRPPDAPEAPPQGAQPPVSPYEPTQLAAQRPPAARSSDPDVGRVVGERYRLVSRLGHGGMGTVWRAQDQVMDREVAVKEPRVPDHLPDSERQTVYRRMEREARAAARIDHPSVVTVHDVVVEEGRPWIVMELVSGQSLGDRLAEGTLDPREAARIGLAVLGALSAAHDAGVLHRDVKPDNVLLGRDDRVVLTDFGIAQIEGEQGLTETGGFVGSPEFIAPERVLGQRPGPESDLWSLGVVLYTAVEGMSPFRRSHSPSTLQAVLQAEPQTPARAVGPLGDIIMRMLRKDTSARPSAQEIRQALETAARPPRHTPTVSAAGAPTMAASGVPTMAVGAGFGAAPSAVPEPSGSRFVPPILHKNRKAQLGLGALVLVVAATLVLVLAKPFASESPLPSGWTVREERDVVGASLAVPENYKRVQDDDTAAAPEVRFKDPSGVYTIRLRALASDTQRKVTTTDKVAAQIIAFNKSGALSEMEEPKVSKTRATRQQGDPAADFETTYFEPGTSSDDVRIPYMDRDHVFVVTNKIAWQLTVTMPAEGDARKTGDEMYKDILENFKINKKFRLDTD
ncbi:serine/threonine-protein kinase [Streptomyces coffeae]|uniref:non-specific serine/threonine protein kinase n=1 Tax=Streptomyces coffeae TaxID=621382 RepID=A0ABS1N632_9ACTN|nr:serine/threonine-protein kinase [Streptomyces coffeae]MBL1095415.1 protein kinase [Streptomyces coffeae]